jgi:hypothetical protein
MLRSEVSRGASGRRQVKDKPWYKAKDEEQDETTYTIHLHNHFNIRYSKSARFGSAGSGRRVMERLLDQHADMAVHRRAACNTIPEKIGGHVELPAARPGRRDPRGPAGRIRKAECLSV